MKKIKFNRSKIHNQLIEDAKSQSLDKDRVASNKLHEFNNFHHRIKINKEIKISKGCSMNFSDLSALLQCLMMILFRVYLIFKILTHMNLV